MLNDLPSGMSKLCFEGMLDGVREAEASLNKDGETIF